MTVIQRRVRELIKEHGSLRAAARAVDCDPSYLMRLRDGGKDNPQPELASRMGLRCVVRWVYN